MLQESAKQVPIRFILTSPNSVTGFLIKQPIGRRRNSNAVNSTKKGELKPAKVLNQVLKPIQSQTRYLSCGFAPQFQNDEPVTSNSKFFMLTYALNNARQARIVFSPLEHLLPGIGEAFPYLETLYVSGKSVKLVQRRDFANMRQLTVLSLGLSIEFLPDDLLTDLPKLTEIKLNSCGIDKIP